MNTEASHRPLVGSKRPEPKRAKPRNTDVHDDGYGLIRTSRISRQSGEVQWLWMVHISRQHSVISRQFFDHVYGSEQSAYQVACAFRDAAMLLIPPLTIHQRMQRPRRNNRSGVPGVMAQQYADGSVRAWLADAGAVRRYFSARLYGANKAREMAIETREQLLRKHPNTFATHSKHARLRAEQEFSHLLAPSNSVDYEIPSIDDPQSLGMDAQTRKIRIEALHAWFDQMRPHQVYVRMSLSRIVAAASPNSKLPANAATTRLSDWRISIVVTDGGREHKVQPIQLRLLRKTFLQQLPLAWMRIEQAIAQQHSADIAQAFAQLHRHTFMASTPRQGFSARMLYPNLKAGKLQDPPPELAELFG